MTDRSSSLILPSDTPGIVFDHVWKKFRRGQMYDSLRDLIPDIGRRLVGRRPPRDDLSGSDFWALRDVSFQVRPGEALGVIGANGAGKSTVLKTLTQIMRPTRGHCEVRGRIGALIEIAAGFHQDLSGRENVFLQGAIMGMRRTEIAAKFDEIVAFAEVGEFIDTPVKRYSSGMNARLGFAIAAHLDPDVLIIDEVLAVGDVHFQHKAFGRIQQLAKSGIPVVVVSHQLDRIVSMCTHAILLERGVVAKQGTPSECVAAFVAEGSGSNTPPRPDDPIVISSLAVGDASEGVRSGERMRAVLGGEVRRNVPGDRYSVGLRLRAAHSGEVVYWMNNAYAQVPLPDTGPFELQFDLQVNLLPGVYTLETFIWSDTRDAQVIAGPNAHVHVTPAAHSFRGSIQLNARVTSRTPDRPAAAGAGQREPAGAIAAATAGE